MKIQKELLIFCSLLLVLAAVSGCKSDPVRASIDAGHAFNITPPAFVGSPAALLLTNAEGFIAQVAISNAEGAVSGQLIADKTRLLFLPANQPAKKGSLNRQAISFIWNPADNSGYVLSEALQGYAPLAAGTPVTNANLEAETNPEFATVNGHPCRKSEAVLTGGNGRSDRFVVWRATDVKRFPVRIESAAGASKLSINLTNVRFKSFESELFLPPEGFTKYLNADAMATELVVRTAGMKKPTDGRLMREPTEAYDNLQTPGRTPGH